MPLTPCETLLVERFVPKHLGINHITKDEAKSHNTEYTKVRLLSLKKIKPE